MLKNSSFIVSLHNKYRNIYLSLHSFNSVIINITMFHYQVVCKLIDSKRIPSILESFFYSKKLTLLTHKNPKKPKIC